MSYDKGTFFTVPKINVVSSCGGTAYLIFIALCEFMNCDKECFPSIQAICLKTGLSRRMVFYHLKTLEQNGFIVRFQRFGKYGQITTFYLLSTANPREKSKTVAQPIGVQSIAHRTKENTYTNNILWFNRVCDPNYL